MHIFGYYGGMMYEAIQNFPHQLKFLPEIEHKEKLGRSGRFVVLGMGGSNLAPGLLKAWKPELDIVSHRDYGLPHIADDAEEKTLVIASSHSGNTEETIDGFEEAGRCGIPRAAISVGGKLRDMARQSGVPFVQFPDLQIQPRSALGLSIRAILYLIRECQTPDWETEFPSALGNSVSKSLEDIAALAAPLAARMADLEKQGKELAERIKGYMPVIYASRRNAALAENWKIKFNETAKIPAFYNVFPELNHNEMTGLDVIESTRGLSEKLFFIFLRDSADHPKVQRRMTVTAELYANRGLRNASLDIAGAGFFEKIFSSTLTADWTAYHTSQIYGTEPDAVPIVEEFKKLIA